MTTLALVKGNAHNIYLVGPMGSGKTAVGRRLAALLDKQFLDADAEIEKRTGVDVRFIFEKEGEARFRERECEVYRLKIGCQTTSPCGFGIEVSA